MIYRKYLKRLCDIFCALAAIIVFGWLYIIIAILVKINLGSPIIFKQDRPGIIDPKTGKETIFKLYKFRTMTDERDENGEFLSDAERLTKFGRFLRGTSLDELPEVFNILKGDMSLIGPRPWAVSYLPYFNEEEHHRHDVRPGISGWAQVNGRTSVNWDQRIAYDLEYVEKLSFGFDLKIVFMTIIKIIKKSDIVEADEQVDFDVYRSQQK